MLTSVNFNYPHKSVMILNFYLIAVCFRGNFPLEMIYISEIANQKHFFNIFHKMWQIGRKKFHDIRFIFGKFSIY